jgi:hypothetical protein
MKRRKMTPAEQVVMDEIRERTRDMVGRMRHVANVAEKSADGSDPESGAEYLICMRSTLSREIKILAPLLKAAKAIPQGVTP